MKTGCWQQETFVGCAHVKILFNDILINEIPRTSEVPRTTEIPRITEVPWTTDTYEIPTKGINEIDEINDNFIKQLAYTKITPLWTDDVNKIVQFAYCPLTHCKCN